MKRFDLILRLPAGAVLVGGHSAVPDGVHGAHAEGPDGRPGIPATALRGALRESLEAVLRGVGEAACTGGDGVDPAHGVPGVAVPCTLDGGRRCKACRLFGSRRGSLDERERAFSGLVLGDARVNAGPAGWSIRPGVAMARESRSAADQRLFLQRVPSTPDQRYVAQGRLLDAELLRYFEAAVRATTHIGAGRSRGLARVEIELIWYDEDEPAAPSLPPEGDVRVRVKLLAPASIGAPVVHPQLHETRRDIPGAALRGAVGFALAEALQDPDGDADFQALVAEDGASFGFLYPVDEDEEADGLAGPLPITAIACKQHGQAHGLLDSLLDRLAIAHVTEVVQVDALERGMLSACAECGQPMRAAAGWRRRRGPVPTRTITRVALDRAHASARDGQLFSQVLLEAGTVFEGVIRNVPARGRVRLAQALARPLSLGRARSAGWGRIEIETFPAAFTDSIEKRAADFDAALQERLEHAGLPTGLVGRLVPITLLSPLLTGGGDAGGALLGHELAGATCYLEARRFSREGGWDQRKRGMEPGLATAAGGVFVLDLGQGRTWRDVLPALQRIEQHGIGLRRHQGYGRAMAFDPFFRKRTTPR